MNTYALGNHSLFFSHAPLGHTDTAFGRWWLSHRAQWRRRLLPRAVLSGQFIKRAFDVAGSLAFLILFSPLFLLLALLVKLEDGGPVFFSQPRVGRFGRELQMYKFRSMNLNAEAELAALLVKNEHAQGITFKIKNDPRITRVGRWLRRFSLDELPQFFNVLNGSMSLVGPRPPTPREVAMYSLADRRRLAIKPGLTCFWQIGGRSNIDFSGQVKLDVQYIESAGFWVDIKILMQTLPAVVGGKGAC